MRADPTMGDAERAQFAMKAWLEIDALESALDHHSCGLERMTGFQAREMLFRSVDYRGRGFSCTHVFA